jgi:hypothetical protein
MTPAVGTKMLGEMAMNRNVDTGRRIYDPTAPAGTIGRELLGNVARNFAPAEVVRNISEGQKSVGQTAAGFAGISFPKHNTRANQLAAQFVREKYSMTAVSPDQSDDWKEKREIIKGGPEKIKQAWREHKFSRAEALTALKNINHVEFEQHMKAITDDTDALKVWRVAEGNERQIAADVLRDRAVGRYVRAEYQKDEKQMASALALLKNFGYTEKDVATQHKPTGTVYPPLVKDYKARHKDTAKDNKAVSNELKK